MIIRRATEDDAFNISKCQALGWKTAYKNILPDDFLNTILEDRWVEPIKSILKTDDKDIYVVEVDNKIVGTTTFGNSRDGENVGEIYAIYVHPDYQRLGIGKLLMQIAITRLSKNYNKIFLKTLEQNYNARAFYEKLNFVTDGNVIVEELLSTKLIQVRYEYIVK